MSKVKCIIRQDWTTRDASGNLIDRRSFVYVTNEDGTPHVYDSISEARAEIIGNYGRDANRAGILHTHTADDYSGNVHDGYVYIIREDSEEYADAIEHDAAAYDWSAEETAEEIAYRAAIRTANRAALALLDAYAEAIGEHPEEDDPETRAAYKVARDEITGASIRATEHDRETVANMVEAIAEAAAEEATDRAETAAREEYEDEAAAEARASWDGAGCYQIAYSDGGQDATNDGAIWYESAADLARDLRSAYETGTRTHLPYAERID